MCYSGTCEYELYPSGECSISRYPEGWVCPCDREEEDSDEDS